MLVYLTSEQIHVLDEIVINVGTSKVASANRDLGDKSKDFVSGTDVLVYLISEAIFEVPLRVACEAAVNTSEAIFEVPKVAVGGDETLP